MSYSDEWFQNLQHSREIGPAWPKVGPENEPKPSVPTDATTWKPWAQMTAEERRKALAEREDATPRPKPR